MPKLWLPLILFILPTLSFGQDSQAAAEKQYAEGLYAKAIVQFERLITRDGRKPELLMGLGKSLYGLKESRRSQALFQEVLSKDKNHSGASYWTGRVLARRGLDGIEQGKVLAKADLRDSVIFYRDAVDSAKNKSEAFAARLAAAQSLMYLLDFKEALIELRLAKKIEPENEVVNAHLLGALYRAGEYDEFLKFARGRPEGIDRHREFDAVLRLGRIEEAQKLFIDLIEKHGFSGRTDAYDTLDLGCAAIKRPDAHLAILEAMVEANPNEHFALYYLGYAQAVQGQNERAEATFKRYLAIAPDDWKTTRHLAAVQRILGKISEAEKTIRIAMELNSSASVVREEIASIVIAYISTKDYKAALNLHSLLLGPEASAQTRRDYAILLKENGDLATAAKILRAICEEESVEGFRLSGYWNDLGLCLKGQKKRVEAKNAFEKAISIFNFNADAQENLGVMHYEDGRLSEARSLLEQAMKSRLAEDKANYAKNWRSRYYLKLVKSARIRVAKGLK